MKAEGGRIATFNIKFSQLKTIVLNRLFTEVDNNYSQIKFNIINAYLLFHTFYKFDKATF